MDDALRNTLFELLAPPNIEDNIERLVNTVALVAAGKSSEIRAGAVDWLRGEVVENLSKFDEFRGKDITQVADLLAKRLAKRIDEIEAIGAGRA
ncbi:hypothetical protein [Methylocystis hirsuta]|uniref:Uncharacterized protein n=1 Tax=Methylocystis hirsuta TaxID=369798 RepID=A0A3M9XR75_9HYPH|nr:hypothetical protein [Methylocystis hirsuta]RNJ50282.1 hypothetical protein D1O30_12420 [Methylocystis hirsuta]